MSCEDYAIRVRDLCKCYALFQRPADRLKQMLWRGRRKYYREFWALRDVSFTVRPGEVLGIVGRNGAGKSTLLQLLCGTLTPTSGSVEVRGRIAALLELGSGFNPEFTGQENIYLSAAILGLSKAEIDARFAQIVEFSGIREFLDQPVKTYSSGMYVRLAFSVATCVDPDILIIDEALSVGDGAFAKKSFDRIMHLRDAGTTIVFCSHNLFQVDALCQRVLWLEGGQVMRLGEAKEVLPAYGQFLEAAATPSPTMAATSPPQASSAFLKEIWINEQRAPVELTLQSGRDDVHLRICFASPPSMPAPSVGVGIRTANDWVVSSMGSHNDGLTTVRDDRGHGRLDLTIPRLPLLKGQYFLDVYLLCERGIHVYDLARPCATLTVRQNGLEQGVVSLPHYWQASSSHEP